MSSEREPFTEPFTDENMDADVSTDNTELSTDVLGTANVPDDTEQVTEVTEEVQKDSNSSDAVTNKAPIDTNNRDVVIMNGISYIKQTGRHRLQGMVRVPDNLKYRISVIAVNERRNITTVIEIALDEYLKTPMCEPRPYLPFTAKDCKYRMNYYIFQDVCDAVSLRAKTECRSEQDIVRRAVLNYIEKSPYDPFRSVVSAEPTGMSGNIPENQGVTQ